MVTVESLLIGIVTFILIIITIRTSKMRIKDSIFWIIWTLVLSIFSFIPEASWWIKDLMGIKQYEIFFLIVVVTFSYFVMFRNTSILSQHEDKIKELTQVVAIELLEQKKINQNLNKRIDELEKKIKNE